MRSVWQLLRKIKRLIKYVFFYLFGAMLIILLFGVIYSFYNLKNAFQISCEVFFGIQNSAPNNLIVIFYIERIVYNLFSLIIVSNALAKLLTPPSPILFSKYVTYDTVDRTFTFKYWIMIPHNKFLHNVKIKLMLAEHNEHQKGINKIQSIWQLKHNNFLDLARGIRFVELSENDSNDLLMRLDEVMQRESDKDGKLDKESWGIDFFISGQSENGTNYHGHVTYSLDDILFGYRNVPMRRNSYSSEFFYRKHYLDPEQRQKINTSKDFEKSGKKEFFRFQHFDKVYKLTSSVKSDKRNKAEIAGDVLTRYQIEYGQYKGIKQIIIDLASFITWFIYNSDRSISGGLHTLGAYTLDIMQEKVKNAKTKNLHEET